MKKEEKNIQGCHFNIGNKSCGGNLYPICSSHLNELLEVTIIGAKVEGRDTSSNKDSQ